MTIDASFSSRYGRPPTVQSEAHGRVNLIGEHTDYNGGFVLPVLIARRTRVMLAPRDDQTVRLISTAAGTEEAAYHLGDEAPGRGWLDYAQGVTALLRADGYMIGGFNALAASDLPLGGGLASSAALVIALLRALRSAWALPLDDLHLALTAHQVETEFVGAHVGVMDPIAISMGRRGSALLLDTRDLSYRLIALPASVEVAAINSGIAHRLAGGDYNTRRQECEAAAALLGVAHLRDVTAAELDRVATLPPPLGRRVRHVVTENERVLATAEALAGENLGVLGALFAASHASMRDDYEVSIPEIDLLVRLAVREPAVIGARLTGGGFGGSIVVLLRRGTDTAARIAAAYQRASGKRPDVIDE